MYTLDTNPIIYFLKNDPVVVAFIQKLLVSNDPIFISTITEIELFGFPNMPADEEKRILDILETLTVIPVDSRIARTAGSLRRMYGLKTADAGIAATALATGSILATRNIRDFKKVPGLEIASI